MRSCARPAILVALLFVSPAVANAGTITSTVGGLDFIPVSPSGALVTIDSVITFGPTTVGGAGAAFELSFEYFGTVVGGGGATIAPAGWFDLAGGSFTCAAGHCENIVGAGDFLGTGAVFPSGSIFVLPSITIDTTGLAPGFYAMGAGFTGPGDAVVNPGAVDLSLEYFSVPVLIYVAPEPGTALLVAIGLVALGARRR